MFTRRSLLMATGVGVGAVATGGVVNAVQAGTAAGTAARGSHGSRASRPVRLGLASPGLPYDGSAFKQSAQALRYRPVAATFFIAWSHGGDFPVDQAQAMRDYGAVPVLTWEPWDPDRGRDQDVYGHAAICRGDHDAYIRRWARRIRSFGSPVVVRFMHEANGFWYPWSVGQGANTEGSFVAAWRRVVRIFRSEGARNAEFRFTANVDGDPQMPRFEGHYPGARYVDSLGLDGYNFGTTQPWSRWATFADIVEDPLQRLARLADGKPVHIDETGCAEQGGDKAQWVQEMLAYCAERPQIQSLTWFDFNKETDWRIASSQRSLAAFRRGLARR